MALQLRKNSEEAAGGATVSARGLQMVAAATNERELQVMTATTSTGELQVVVATMSARELQVVPAAAGMEELHWGRAACRGQLQREDSREEELQVEAAEKKSCRWKQQDWESWLVRGRRAGGKLASRQRKCR